MDYLHADHYSHGGDSYYTPQANPYIGAGMNYNPNTSFDRHSDQSSHLSLHSTGSNRPGARQAPRIGEQSNDAYSSYAGMARVSEDDRGSPMPRNPRESPYHNLPQYREAPSPNYPDHTGVDDSFGPRDEYGGVGAGNSYPVSGDNYPAEYRQSPTGDPYQTRGLVQPEYVDDHGDPGPPYDESYRDSPYHLQDYPPNALGRIAENIDHYHDGHQTFPQQPNENIDHYHDGHQTFPQQPDDSFQGDHYQGGEQQMYRHDPYLDSPQQRHSYDHEGYQRQSPLPGVGPPRYRASYDEGHPLQQYDGELPGEDGPRYRGSYNREEPAPYGGLPADEAPAHYRGSYDHEGSHSYGASHDDGQPARTRGSYQDGRNPNDSFEDPGRKYEGLPPVRTDPFADDPFRDQRSHDGSFAGLRDEEPYHRGQSPSGDMRQGPYDPHPYDGHEGADYLSGAAPRYDDYMESQPYPGETERAFYPDETERPFYPQEVEMERRMGSMQLAPPATEGYHPDDRRTPSVDGRPPFGDYHRAPDLQEVIEYLSSPDDSIKANAAAYLQHLSFNDDGIKAKTRSLGGIQPLIELLSNELTEVHRNACGALQNLSFGKANDENKRAIKNLGGVPELIRLLRKTDQEDVMDSVTGILWNLSSCEDLKQVILDDGLTVLVNVVVLPYSGWNAGISQPSQRPWTTVFRNTTGILRNISSAGYDARKKLRECRSLVNALIHALQQARDDNNIDCKPVENVVCILRNLSYRVQEMEDPDFYKKRSVPRSSAPPSKEENSGCFGGGGKKAAKKTSTRENTPQRFPPKLPPSGSEYQSLWGNDLIQLYLLILKSCTNPVSMEAAAGAIQNLTACDWEPAVECRAFVRKAKGLPILVDLLSNESNRVVCAAATALRNLTIDEKNKELVGKYSIQQLVAWLPRDTRHAANKCPDDLICAVLATLYEVIRSNQDYAVSLIQEDGLSRLKYINTSEGRFLARTLKINHTILKTLWSFKSLHGRYSHMGFTEQDFLVSKATPRPDGYRDSKSRNEGPVSSNHTTPYNTLSRPISAQGYDDSTLSTGRAPPRVERMGYGGGARGSRSDMDGYLQMNQGNPAFFDQDRGNYSRDRIPVESVPLSDMGPGYAPLDEPRPHKKPVGGVPLFPNLPPSRGGDRAQQEPSPTPQDLSTVPEPLYAQVNKGRRRHDDYTQAAGGGSSAVILDASGGQGGADSWV
ncbi:armadillo repeat protein deleted in velo-cardio-facial syndrome homolog isoform X2 [Pomacea canaliculata]|nr:armadillo repeat protein deleted in velo-cardio-facial syndrome homolog isoform X2 [Pomacea canaliculata]